MGNRILEPLEVGDVVRLTSSSILMTVQGVHPEQGVVDLIWLMDSGEVRGGRIPMAALVKVDHECH